MWRPPINRNDPPHFVEKLRQKSHQVVKEILEMEMLKNYTCNPDYMKMWTELMDGQEAFMEAICNHSKSSKLMIKVVGEVDILHLRGKHERIIKKLLIL
ncbi:Dynamin-related protein 4C [Platanthera guangdongensis]|uniref:Dynamin-related protein 4C n=1 Tax=Platanthera guangdongensis TaxID=2320717 RepID=A0ABR2N388_9ASPA